MRSETAGDCHYYNGLSPWLCALVRDSFFQNGRDGHFTPFAALGEELALSEKVLLRWRSSARASE
jgi:hypothetical protein